MPRRKKQAREAAVRDIRNQRISSTAHLQAQGLSDTIGCDLRGSLAAVISEAMCEVDEDQRDVGGARLGAFAMVVGL